MKGDLWRYDPAGFRREFIENERALDRAVAELSQSPAIGVDLEMVQRVVRKPGGYQEWVQVLALIQIASEAFSIVVDPLRCKDISGLRNLMASQVRKVFLGGGQDASLLEHSNIPARHIIDVGEVALAIFGRREDGMAALSRRMFDLSLDKTVRRADWMARPLNPTLLAYAHRDAELTLLIYRWFQQHFPEVVSIHERFELDPQLPSSAPAWLREAMTRASTDSLAIAMDKGLDPKKDAETMSEAVRHALLTSRAPRQINRLLRIAGDLGLKPIALEIPRYVDSQSSLIRASAARALGQLAEPETALPLLDQLKQDPVDDVKKAADAALREIKAPRIESAEPNEPDEQPSLGDSALSALQALKQKLEDEAGMAT